LGQRCRTQIEQIAYPLVIKPVRRAVGQGVTVGIRDLGALMQAVSDANRVAGQFIVERFVRGVNVRLLLVGGELLSAFDARGSRSLAGLHDSIRDMAVTIARALDSGLMVLTVVAPRLDRPLAETGGAFVDLDVSPELGQLLPRTRALRRSIMDRYVEWLFPDGAPSRIPIVAVTGTNGKTTTSRMVARMLETGGYRTGLSCSDGLYLGAERIVGKDPRRFKRKMRHRLILDANVEAAAMEFYLAVIKRHGFPFQSCDVSVLTNVAADHLQMGWETVEQLADIKRAVLERADKGVVMNADDANTERLLAAFQPPRLALASTRCSIDEIRLEARDDACYVILEPGTSGEERVVIYDMDKRIDLIAVDEIPATMRGKARFNIENALHAIGAGYLLGLDPAVLAAAVRDFSNNFEETPGRLNIYDGLPFRVIMDYAHNEHGYARLSEFTDQLDVPGRRILVYSVSGDRVPHDVRQTALAPVGHFDHFICRDFPDPRGRQPGEMPRIMQGLLRETGIPHDRVRAFDDPTEAIEAALSMAREGDLVVFSPGSKEMEKLWQRIRRFEYAPGREN
jgi:cyanophycin synthetase